MTRDHRSRSNDPTAERTANQSIRSGALGHSVGEPDDELVNRTRAETTPRRYDQPIEEDEDAVVPEDDSTTETSH
jgi:hypothetical protein